jgi:PAS domain S-box-containing protein
VILLPALVFAGAALVSYQQHFAEAWARLSRGVDILYEQSAKVFETLDLVAGRVDEILAGLPNEEIWAREGEFHNRAKAIAAPLEQVQFVLVINEQGHPLVFSAIFPTDRSADYSGRDYFKALRDSTAFPEQTFVSAVLQGRLRTDNTTFLIARRRGGQFQEPPEVAPESESFRGLIAISTKPTYFVEQFRQIAGRDLDTVTLLRADGAVLARYPGTVDVAARLSSTSTFMTSIAQSPQQGAYETVSGVDNIRRLYVYRRLPHHPVYVTAGIDRATVLAQWRGSLARYLLFGLPATGALVLLALTALRRTRGEAIAVRQLAERTRELDRVWRTSRDLFAVGSLGGVLRSANPAWSETLGFPPDEIVGQTFEAFIHPDEIPAAKRAIEHLALGKVVRDLDVRLRGKNGSEYWFSWTWVPEGDTFYASGRDITDRRQLSDQLRQAQKMEAVGQLTGGIAHDFNNMLGVVIGSLDLLGRRLGTADVRAHRYIGAATEGARRAAILTQRLLAFSRQQSLRPEPIDANKLVAGMSDLLQRSLGAGIRLETVLAGGLWRTYADPNGLENVILNLAVNARDAMPEGGRLTIETGNAHLDDRYAAAHFGVSPGQYVLIAVTDSGTGMPAEIVAKAFDPFFTTKEVGKGTGLGLSQVYGFVKQSRGHVKIYSEPGQGTTIKIYLPRLVGGAQETTEEDAVAEVLLGDTQEIVLVVEDEPAMRQFSVDALVELGYRVLEADGAASALRLLDAHPNIALLFTDVVMPEVNGRKLAEEARRRRPGLKVLFTTGYTRNAVVHNGVLDPGVELIGKPFTLDELAAKVRAVIDMPATQSAGWATQDKS